MRLILKIFFTCIAAIFCIAETGNAQWKKKKPVEEKKQIDYYNLDSLLAPIPRTRQSFHDRIDNLQKKAVAGSSDKKKIYFSEDTVLNNILTKALLNDINRLQVLIENAPANGRDMNIDNQMKIGYLKSLAELLVKYNADTKIDPYYYKKLVANLHDMIIAANENQLMEFTQKNLTLYTLDNCKIIYQQKTEERTYLYTELGKMDPKMMIERLSEYAGEPFACNIISEAARIDPTEVFNFASSTNFPLRTAVRKCDDDLVQCLVNISDKSKSPLKALPFLGDLYSKRLSIDQIDNISAHPESYFKNLVRLKIEHKNIGGDTYSDELAYRCLRYVREMDELHEEKDTVRFKCIDSMPAEALYYIMVYGQDEIYTSSFIGCFKRFMLKMAPRSGYDFLEHVHEDHFRTFIRMCAGYNTLGIFLASMDEDKKLTLMNSFMAGLEKGKDNELEDAVDVADAYGSIKDSALLVYLNKQVKINYEASYKSGSKKGLFIYSILSVLFNGLNTGDNDDLLQQQSEKLGLPPVYFTPYANLKNENGVIERFFFFGDQDGKNSYNSFLSNFKDNQWKIITEAYWTKISSIKGQPVVIYANLPLDEPQDEEAQNKLSAYLQEQHIHPVMVVHRGHSYHLPLTLAHIEKQNKIIVLGSCGGYHNLTSVLDHAPDAQIISSKQTGTMWVNEPIMKAINDDLLAGKDINWVQMWKGLNELLSKKAEIKEKFDDYVPPYKNMGALIIKAYRNMQHSED